MFGLGFGELFIVSFITIAVVSAPWWPKAGEWIVVTLFIRNRGGGPNSARPETRSLRQ